MAREKAAASKALGKKKTKASKEVRGSLLDLVILLPVLAFIFFSITHPAWYSTYITGPLFGPLLKQLGWSLAKNLNFCWRIAVKIQQKQNAGINMPKS